MGDSFPPAELANLQIFRAYFGLRPDEVPDELFRLRYEVYCMERAYLKAEAMHDGRERDEYDHCSTHFAAYTREETLVGTVRLVTPAAQRAYPFELHCPTFSDFHMPPRAKCGEVSRLAVKRSHRRRRADSVLGVPGFTPPRHADVAAGGRLDRCAGSSPMLLLGMYREMYRHSRTQGIRYWFTNDRTLMRCPPIPFLAIVTGILFGISVPAHGERAVFNFNLAWRLLVADPANAADVAFDDKDWKPVSTPSARPTNGRPSACRCRPG